MNNLLTTKNIARQILPELIENLVAPNLFYKDYSDTFAKQGDTIRVRKPVVLTAKDFTAGTPVTEQDVIEESVDVTLDKIATVDVSFEAIQSATNVDDLNRMVIRPAAIALAEKINSDGLDLYKQVPYTAGTAGTTPSTLADFAAAREALNANKAPLEGRCAIWSPEADSNFVQIPALVNAEKSGSTAALRDAAIGKVFGISNYMAQGVKSHTTGAAGTVAIDNAGGYAIGATAIHLDGLTAACAVGDILTIDGNKYAVIAAGALSSADQDVTISPALKTAVKNDAGVTVTASHVANLVFHPNAFAFVTRPLIAPAGVESYTTSYNGISLRVVRGYDMSYKREKLSVDVLYGYKCVYPELAVRYLG